MPDERIDRRAVWLWGAAFVLGTFGAGLLARHLQFGSMATMAFIIPPMLLIIPFVRAGERAQSQCGALSPARRRYNRRAMGWSFGYMVLLFIAIAGRKALWAHGVEHSALLWILAILPALPLLYLLWAMHRYLAEEHDEYLRTQMVNSALFATGLLLASSTIWGFLGTFGLVRQAPGWMAVAIWAVGLGLGNIVNRWKAP